MGQEIDRDQFSPADFAEFDARLKEETDLLGTWFRDRAFASATAAVGIELEAWLVDPAGEPACLNGPFLDALNDPRVVPELARFNFELNSAPHLLSGPALSALRTELDTLWRDCRACARSLGADVAMIGILPSVRPEHLTSANMTPLRRYRALNDQVMRLRGGAPIALDIEGRETLRVEHGDVMLESAATSLQIHLRVTQDDAVRAYNLSKILSAPMVALCANAPWLFGHRLCDETRIPLFEQAVAVGGSDYSRRVTFGIRYARDSLFECFAANRERYPVLLPMLMDEPPERLAHLRLHNGTIWRWTRPLIGFGDDGTPHLRIEHRVCAAGPTVDDVIANVAFFTGLMRALLDTPGLPDIPFVTARANFHAAARAGLDASIEWPAGHRVRLGELIVQALLPAAHHGLQSLDIDDGDRERWLGIVAERVRTGRTGAHWQTAHGERIGRDMPALTRAYLAAEHDGHCVHEWPA